MQKKIILIITLILLLTNIIYAQRTEIRDREIIEKLHNIEIRITRLEEEMKNLEIRMARLEENQKNLYNRLDGLQGLMLVLLASIFTLIGFVIWDRRIAISPVIKKTKSLEDENEKIIQVLKDYAKLTPKLASILKSHGIL